ncbi:MAG: GNAT family N-acetyltransferase [Hyphomicrobiales bacterium]|nr:MAG: GNAT family N-acetyltransferase [Hyphomicrobiales bacterium]
MADNVVIRELTGFEEIATIFPLYGQSSSLSEAAFRERLGAMLAQGNYRCIAAYLDGRMVGLSGFWIGTQLWSGKYAEPDHVLVVPELRSLGIGARLMGWIEAEALRLGCDVTRIAMILGRERTHSFYHHNGYSDDGLIMVKPLSAWAAGAFPEYQSDKAAISRPG